MEELEDATFSTLVEKYPHPPEKLFHLGTQSGKWEEKLRNKEGQETGQTENKINVSICPLCPLKQNQAGRLLETSLSELAQTTPIKNRLIEMIQTDLTSVKFCLLETVL